MFDWYYTAFLTLWGFLGLAAGSFLNVCIYRIPRGESISFPPSHCPGCKKNIKPYDLIPVISYLILKGKCRHCGEKISNRYPVVELLTGVCFLVLFIKFGLSFTLAKYLFLSLILIAVTFIDLEHYIIPNELVIAGLIGGTVLHPLAGDLTLLSSLYGILSTTGFLLFIYIISPVIFKQEGLGGGDIKLSLVMGLFLGWPLSLLAVFLACCLAGTVGIGLVAFKKKSGKDPIPFGPFLAMGTFIGFMWGKDLINWYLLKVIHVL